MPLPLQLCNCLEDSRRSQGKYLSRARARVSSFWSLTKQEEGGPVQYLCLVEVWHTAGGNEIRQAEGLRPRTIPGPEARERLEPYDPNPNPKPSPNPNPNPNPKPNPNPNPNPN